MRQSLAKGTRRALRRAVGTAAVESLTDMEAAINGQGLAVTQVRADIAALARDHAVFKKSTNEQIEALKHDCEFQSGRVDRVMVLISRSLSAWFRRTFGVA